MAIERRGAEGSGAVVIGTDVASPMLRAARRRVSSEGVAGRVGLVRAPMDDLPLRDASVDLLVGRGGPVIYEGTFRAVRKS